MTRLHLQTYVQMLLFNPFHNLHCSKKTNLHASFLCLVLLSELSVSGQEWFVCTLDRQDTGWLLATQQHTLLLK